MKVSWCNFSGLSFGLFRGPCVVGTQHRRHLRVPYLKKHKINAMDCATKASSFPVQVKAEIELSKVEQKIFDYLLGTVGHFRLDTELRVAGGWVRDKLLGKDCYDIDIAIDNMLGSDFADKVTEYLLILGEEAQGVGIIPRNPDQSKHLETARMRLCDLWIDFVNLRSEDYSENCRIPTMEFGTAKDDAYRRDLTINSLFYNINNATVEDFTQRGIEDLRKGKIVTPLPPKTTFLDDPLRVLRAIRFGARFEFELDEELKEAAACEEVKTALSAKISKERIGTEIELMISGSQPVRAVTYIEDFMLFDAVFALPPNFDPPLLHDFKRVSVAYLDAAWELINAIGYSSFGDDERRIALYSALFLTLKDITYKDLKGKKIPVVNYVLKDSLKRKSSDSEMVIKVHSLTEKIVKLVSLSTDRKSIPSDEFREETEFLNACEESKLRVVLGFLVREIKDYWRVALLIGTLLCENGESQVEKGMRLFNAAESEIKGLGLEKIWEEKPILNGKEIIKVLELECGGPLVSEWQRKVLAWQLAHPGGTSEQCVEWVKESCNKRLKVTDIAH